MHNWGRGFRIELKLCTRLTRRPVSPGPWRRWGCAALFTAALAPPCVAFPGRALAAGIFRANAAGGFCKTPRKCVEARA